MSGINATGQVSVATTATLIIAANGVRQAVLITNTHATATVFLGVGLGVTTATGHALTAGSSITLPVGSPVYGIVAASTATVTYVEVD